MTAGWAIVDGEGMPLSRATVPATDPAVIRGWSVYETARVEADGTHRLGAHLARLARSCAAACIPMPPPELLLAEAVAAAGKIGGPSWVRITLTGGGLRLVTAVEVDGSRLHQPVTAARGVHRDEPVLGGAVKHGSRAPWEVALRRAGTDMVLLVDGSGRFTEATTAAIVAVRGGVLWTAPHDGRILESTTLVELLARADALGIAVRREGPPAWGPWDALYVASSTRDLGPVILLDGEPLPGWDPVGLRLRDTFGER